MAKRPQSRSKDGGWRKKRSDGGKRRVVSKGSSKAPQINARLRKQGRRFTDSVEITRSDRHLH